MAHGFQSALSGSRFYQASGFAGGYDFIGEGFPTARRQLLESGINLARWETSNYLDLKKY